MPDWLVVVITVVMVGALVLVTWTLGQAWLNYVAADGVVELAKFSRNKLFRIAALWLAQSALAALGLISFLFERTETTRAINLTLLIILALGVAGASLHEYLGMKAGVEERSG